MSKCKLDIVKGKPYPMFETLCLAHGLPQPEREVVFHQDRGWKFDFAWYIQKVALEVEGGAFKGHGHRSVGKYLKDIKKYNEATLIGWKLLRCTTDDIKSGTVCALLKRALQMETSL